jgi:tetratricopeptide (TPR) repeat protein
MAGGWTGDLGTGRDIAWRHRSRLPKRDLLQLYTIVGQNYPIASAREDINNAEAWVSAAPDDPEAWSRLGDHFFHYGALAGVSDAPGRSLRAYARAARLDATYAPTFEHLHELHYALGDTAAARRTLAHALHGKPRDADPSSRWFARTCLGDTVMGLESPTSDSLASVLGDVIGVSLEHACGLAEAESLLSIVGSTLASLSETRAFQTLWWTFYVTRGKPSQALVWQPDPSNPVLRAGIILDALYADADMVQAARLAARIARRYPRPTLGTGWESIVEQYAGAQYQLASRHPETAQQAVQVWKGVWAPGDTSQALRLASHLGLLLDAQLAALQRRPDALARLTELDSVLLTGPTYGDWLPTRFTFGGLEPVANLVAARLWHKRDEPGRALAAIRRRTVGLRPRSIFVSQIRDEARYAALVGDREGAVRAYQHYLTLRADPELALQPQVDAVRAEFEALQGEAPDR